MKKLLLTMFGALFPLLTFAEEHHFNYTYEGQSLYYTILDEGAKTVKTKEGDGLGPGNRISGTLVIPSTVIHYSVEYTVTQIGSYSFSKCTGLTSVTIPGSVKLISQDAFSSSGLTSVVIPEGVTTINGYSFAEC